MSRNIKEQHWDAGLTKVGDASHVNAALQALLHIPQIREIIMSDTDHQKKCRSILKCLPCSLSKLISNMKTTRMGNPASLVTQWNVVSSAMDPGDRKDAYEVFIGFILKLRLEFVKRDPDFTSEDYWNSPFSKLFEGEKNMTVLCKLCGESSNASRFGTVEVSVLSEDAVQQYLLDNGKELCIFCEKFQVDTKTNSVEIGPYLLVHSKVPCSPSFKIPLTMKVHGNKLQFKSCIVQNEEKSIFISLCADGSVRQFENEKIQNIHLGTLVTSSEIFRGCSLTAIYANEKTQIQAPRGSAIHKQSNLHQLKVTGMPNTDCDLYSDLPEPPKTRNVATQTDAVVTVDTGSQTTQEKQPMISYEKCKNHPKFQFFTGHDTRDFEAFYDFIGGEDMLSHLKQHYNLKTPEKPRKSVLTSKDKLFIFLLRLRRGLPLEEMAFIFDISVPYASEICYTLTRLVYETFKGMEDILLISAAEQAKTMPLVMKSFKNLRVILDGASFFIETPSNFQMQGNTYSDYKHHNCVVFMVGVSCRGGTVFCSEGFEGNMSDKGAILNSPGFLSKLQKGDCVMVDRGFDITADLLKIGVHVVKPPKKSENLNAAEELMTKAVAAARIYVEHAIADIKDNRLLRGTIPLTLLPVLPQLVYIAAFMRNFSSKKVEDIEVHVKE